MNNMCFFFDPLPVIRGPPVWLGFFIFPVSFGFSATVDFYEHRFAFEVIGGSIFDPVGGN